MLISIINLYATISLGTPIDQPHKLELPPPPAITIEQTLPASMIPVKKPTAVKPIIEADGAIIVDFESGEILYSKNSNKKLQIASITKLMTVIVALEEANLKDSVTVSKKAANTEGSKIWLYTGERIELSKLLKASIIHSGNDAAVAIAEHVGGDVDTFVDKMNAKAKELSLFSTHYANPIGFDSLQNYSTVRDLAQLARYAYRKPEIRSAAKIQTATISSINGEQSHDLTSTNKLLGSFLKVLGLKTGHTEAAGLCFISVIENDKGNKIITVVLNSPARFEETKMLASWAFRSHIW